MYMAKSAKQKNQVSEKKKQKSKVTQLVATIIQHPFSEVHPNIIYPHSEPKPLVINKAIYYTQTAKEKGKNVTSILNALVINNKLTFIVDDALLTNAELKGYIMKELEIKYTYNRITSTIICNEGDTVILQGY